MQHYEIMANPELFEVMRGIIECDCGNWQMCDLLRPVIRKHSVRFTQLAISSMVNRGNFIEALLRQWKGYAGYEPRC